LRASSASGSVVDSCVALPRFSPRKSTAGFFESSGGGRFCSSFLRKLFTEAHASISHHRAEELRRAVRLE
jgi:hypothetical protein